MILIPATATGILLVVPVPLAVAIHQVPATAVVVLVIDDVWLDTTQSYAIHL